MRGALGLPVLWFWLFSDRFFGFCAKKLRFFRFSVHLRFADFPLTFGFRFPRKILRSSYLTYFGSGLSSIWAAITRLHWPRIAAKRKCYWEDCVINQLKYRRDTQPRLRFYWGGGGEGGKWRIWLISRGSCVSNDAQDFDHPWGFTRLEWQILYSNKTTGSATSNNNG